MRNTLIIGTILIIALLASSGIAKEKMQIPERTAQQKLNSAVSNPEDVQARKVRFVSVPSRISEMKSSRQRFSCSLSCMRNAAPTIKSNVR